MFSADDTKYKHKSKSEYSLESDEDEEYSEIVETKETRKVPRGAVGGVQVMPTATGNFTNNLNTVVIVGK